MTIPIIAAVAATALLSLPAHYDVRNGIRRWLGMGNFQDGDCVIAAFEHCRMVKATTNASTWQRLVYRLGFRPPHSPYAVEVYAEFLATLGQKPGPSQGIDPNAFFPWAKEKGLITDWGHVNVDKTFVDSNGLAMRDRLHKSMIDYRGVMLSIELTPNAYNNFMSRTPWHVGTATADTPDPNLAHETLLTTYGPDLDSVVTWGQMKSQTAAFTEATTYEAFVFLDESDTLRPNYAELLANIHNL